MLSGHDILVATKTVQDHVFKPYARETYIEEWRNLPEVPDKSEILPKNDGRHNDEREEWNDYQKEQPYNANLPHNIVKGSWGSKEEYLSAHYQILREDAIANLRSSVKHFRKHPEMDDDQLTHVYTDVYFKGLLLGALGAAFRVEFSHDRARKQIRWEQSKRLQQGTLIALSPQLDSFRSICKVAIVAARPIEGGLDQNPPQIDIFWGEYSDAVFDPAEPYVMIEARSGYFEASRHMLVAIQKLRTEKFQLAKHIVELDVNVGHPEYLSEQPMLDLSSLIRPETASVALTPLQLCNETESLENVDVRQGFPQVPYSGMDESQMSACERMVTKKIAIVQGPPGTGKTFTSVSALRVLIENNHSDSPIIVAAQTNHALDQLMNHILGFEPSIVRLGGRSDKENTEILKRTLYVLRMTTKDVPDGHKGMKAAYGHLDRRVEEISASMGPLLTEDLISDVVLVAEGIITEAQKDSLYEEGWASGQQSEGFSRGLPQWLGPEQLVPIPRAPQINLGFPLEDSDLEFEQLQDLELDGIGESPDESNKDAMIGTFIPFRRMWTGRCLPGVEDRKLKKLLAANENLYDVPIAMRGPLYRYFEKQLNKIMLAKLRQNLSEFNKTVDNIRVVKWVRNIRLIRHLGIKVIGCTTTGLSKYRGLLAALHPRTLLIEEAAETLEGTVIAGMFESLEQLILVGDHQQLQAHGSVAALADSPYNLNISMFERLVNNSIGYTMLNKQRRMIPDIRKLLCIQPNPFYSNLQDHPSVMDREKIRLPIAGMGGKDTYFFNHNWPEARNADMSSYNSHEAEMIAGFFNYLVFNGIEVPKITVLTFYNGQRKTILRELKRHPSLGGHTYFNVFTVDSYQGEENDVILLSLVRSNMNEKIGFLQNKNRLVVALSRARRGLYVFGNSLTLLTAESRESQYIENFNRGRLWEPLLSYMKEQGRLDIDGGLPVTCINHGKTVRIYEADQWIDLAGGCDQKCPEALPCGHQCRYCCHPFDHSDVQCSIPCPNILNCGHGCNNFCGQICRCSKPECAMIDLVGNKVDDFDSGLPAWDTPIKGSGQPHTPRSQPRGGIFASASTTFASTDQRRKDFGPAALHNKYPSGNGFLESRGISSKRSALRDSINIRPSFSTHSQNHWKNWDAQKADKKLYEERKRIADLVPPVDPATRLYKETYRAVTVKDGMRLPVGSSSRVLQHAIESPSKLSTQTQVPARSRSSILHPSLLTATKQTKHANQFEMALPEADPFTSPMEFGLAKLSISSPAPLLPLTKNAIPTNGMDSSNLNDPRGLEVALNPVAPRYGTADDLDRFEQLFSLDECVHSKGGIS